MIQNSFIFLDQINLKTEKNIWDQNITTWQKFIDAKKIKGISEKRKQYYNRKILEASHALFNYNSEYFTKILPTNETYRLYTYFKEDACYLDIETTKKDQISIIGLYDGYKTKTLIRNINLSPQLLKQELSRYKLIITFNGSSFDLPNLKKYFKDLLPNIPHIDLRHVCNRINLTGGLKQIEKQLNLKRPQEIETITSQDPNHIWRFYQATGDKHYLKTLIKYNEEDIINLKPIAEFAIKKLQNSLLSENKKFLY